jgi:hypothetical protein
MPTTGRHEFKQLVLEGLLPTFCGNPCYEREKAGFKEKWEKVSETDARDFLRAWYGGLIQHEGGGRYRAPRKSNIQLFFWAYDDGSKPKPFSLWIEAVITFGVLAKLHFDHGWPRELLGSESKGGAFDVTAFLPHELDNEYIACEVKKTTRETDDLLQMMIRFARSKSAIGSCKPGKEINALRKLSALQSRRAPIFMAVGPNADYRVFSMCYSRGGDVAFEPNTIKALNYDRATSCR